MPQLRFLSADEVEEVFLAYGRRWPVSSRLFAWLLGRPSPADIEASRQLATGLRAVAFRPR